MQKIGDLFFPDIERHFQAFAADITGYQRQQRDKAFEYVRSWKLALDLGANVGIFSRHFAERFEHVIAVEPLDDNIECLRMNVPRNVEIMQIAAGDEERTVTIYKTPKSLGGSFVADHAGVDKPPQQIQDELLTSVPMRTIDSLNLQDVGLIKLDIQGSEVIALKGAEQTLRRCRPVVLIEEKPIGSPTGPRDHIEKARALMLSYGMTAKEQVGADRIYVFE